MKKFLAGVILLAAVAVPSVLFATQGEGSGEARINARKLEDGRIEFAMQVKEGNAWSDRILPRGRYFPAHAEVGKWLNSTPVSLSSGGVALQLPISTAATARWEQDVWYTWQGESQQLKNQGSFTTYVDEFTPGQPFVTSVSIQGHTDHASITNISLNFVCHPGGNNRKGIEEGGYITMWDAASSYDGHEFGYDYTRNVEFVAQLIDWNPGLGAEPTVTNEKRWEQSELTISKEIMRELKQYSDLYVAMWDLGGKRFSTRFPVGPGLATAVQPNLDHCGDY
ncbi:MAG: hypothetical protein OXT70_07020 [Chloroflexota bacterium]|nr:hypothetical protein [Chloroflexota bacterium]